MVNVKMKTTVKIRAKAENSTHSASEVQVRDLVQVIDEPTERGGTNKGPTPTETALSALIGCTNVIGHKCAEALDVYIGELSISAVSSFDRRGVTLTEEIEVPFESIDLTVISNGTASYEQLQAVKAEVAKFCPMAKLFKNAGTRINESWETA